MKIDEKFVSRFDALIAASSEIMATKHSGNQSALKHVPDYSGPVVVLLEEVDGQQVYQWGVSCLHLIGLVFGKSSDHYLQYSRLLQEFPLYESFTKALGVLKAAKEDYDNGFAISLANEISGEIFQSFIELAKRALAEGQKSVAAVLACAALEDALKRYAEKNGVNVEGADMSQVVSALKAKGLVGGAQKTLLDTMPKIRNYAMHADWGKIQEPDVSSVIGFVEQFLITHF
jgi:Domain of unknown function (DUF4145)